MLRSQSGIWQAPVGGALAVVGRVRAPVIEGNVWPTRQFDGLRARHGREIGPRQVGELGLDGFEDFLHEGESSVGAVGDFGLKALCDE